jgi:hypothetical protein
MVARPASRSRHMAQKPIDPRVAEWLATLVGYGCTQEEAARAVGAHAPH